MNGMWRNELKRNVCVCLPRGEIAVVGCPSVWAEAMGGECSCGNLLWQSYRTLIFGERAA